MSAPLALALEIDGAGAHPAAWRRSTHAPDQLLTAGRIRSVAEVSERAGFTLVTIDDAITAPGSGPDITGRIGAVERAAFVAAATSVLSVAPLISTTYTEPFHIGSQLASLDHVSSGRSGWVVAVSPGVEPARAWGRPQVTGVADLQQEAADAVRVNRALWDSWEDDAVIRDVASSRYLNRERLHYIDFIGANYSVKGPAIVPRPPQGQLVVLAPDGLVPAELVDVALVTGGSTSAVRASAADAGTPRVFADIEVALDTPEATAASRVSALEQFRAWPDRDRLRYVGDAGGLIALLRELSRFVDGVRLHPLVLDEDLPVLSKLVLPALFTSQTATRPLPGSSLRTTLGLPRPSNRYDRSSVATTLRTGVTR